MTGDVTRSRRHPANAWLVASGSVGSEVAGSAQLMKACVLLAAPRDQMEALAGVLGSFEVLRVSEPARVALLAQLGSFQAIIAVKGFAYGVDHIAESRIVEIDSAVLPDELEARVHAAIAANRETDERNSYELASLTALSFAAYIELVRFRATRRYLLGLMRRHDGHVDAASQTSGLPLDLLHRHLRRHDINVGAFRGARAL